MLDEIRALRLVHTQLNLQASNADRAALTRELAAQTEELDKVKGHTSKMESSISELNGRLEAAKAHSAQLEGQLNQNRETAAVLKSKNDKLKHDLTAVQGELSSARDRNLIIQEELISAEKANAEALEEFKRLSETLDKTRHELNDKTLQLNKVQEDLTWYKLQLDEASKSGGKIAELKDTIAKLIEEEVKLKFDVDAKEAAFRSNSKRFHEEVWSSIRQRQSAIENLRGPVKDAIWESGWQQDSSVLDGDKPSKKHYNIEIGDARVSYNFELVNAGIGRTNYYELKEIAVKKLSDPDTKISVSIPVEGTRLFGMNELDWELFELEDFVKRNELGHLSMILPFSAEGEQFLSKNTNVKLQRGTVAVHSSFRVWAGAEIRSLRLDFSSERKNLTDIQNSAYKRLLRDAIETFPTAEQEKLKSSLFDGNRLRTDLSGIDELDRARVSQVFEDMLGRPFTDFSKEWAQSLPEDTDFRINFSEGRSVSDFGIDQLRASQAARLSARTEFEAVSRSRAKASGDLDSIIGSIRRIRLVETPEEGIGEKFVEALKHMEKNWYQLQKQK